MPKLSRVNLLEHCFSCLHTDFKVHLSPFCIEPQTETPPDLCLEAKSISLHAYSSETLSKCWTRSDLGDYVSQYLSSWLFSHLDSLKIIYLHWTSAAQTLYFTLYSFILVLLHLPQLPWSPFTSTCRAWRYSYAPTMPFNYKSFRNFPIPSPCCDWIINENIIQNNLKDQYSNFTRHHLCMELRSSSCKMLR